MPAKKAIDFRLELTVFINRLAHRPQLLGETKLACRPTEAIPTAGQVPLDGNTPATMQLAVEIGFNVAVGYQVRKTVHMGATRQGPCPFPTRPYFL